MTGLNYFNQDHEMLRETTRRFIQQEIAPYVDDWEEQSGLPRELFKKAGDAGLFCINVPEEHGGMGEDLFMMIAFTEEIMRCTSGGLVASLGSLGIGLPPVLNFGQDELIQRIAPEVLAGNKIQALAITEPGAGSDVANISTRAERQGDHYIVNGSKTFITSGMHADYVSVAVRTGGEGFGGISMLLMEKDMPGFSSGKKFKKMGWWASDTAELFFDNVKVPLENLIGKENQGFRIIMSNFACERLMLATMANATAQIALEQCLDYVEQRKTFGKNLAQHQVIRHKLADMATQIDVSREYIYRTAAKVMAGESSVKEISMAKNFATKVSDYVTTEAVQIFGGMGYMRESVVERLYRDNRILSIGGGTYEIMNEVIAKCVLGEMDL